MSDRPDLLRDEAWVRDWFARRYAADDVFEDGLEDLTFVAAVQFYRDAVAAERERCAVVAETAMGRFTLASENTDQYVIQDDWGRAIARKIRVA